MMPSLPLFNKRFTPTLTMILLAFLSIIFFVRLGFWQISRGHEKQFMLARQAILAKQPFSHWTKNSELPEQYQPIQLKGQWMPELFFLDNQHHQHQFGYHVLSPFRVASDKDRIILVDRGWVKGNLHRQDLPTIAIPAGVQNVQGMAYYPQIQRWTLGPMIEKKAENITILEEINTKKLSQLLQKKVYPFIIRLNKNAADGFVRKWAVVSMPPQRHFAYAFQWFAIAFVILIIFIALNLKEKT